MIKPRSRRLIMIFILFFAGLISVFLFLHSSFFYIDKITVQGANKLGAEEAIRLSGTSTGINIFTVNSTHIAQALKVHPMVKDARVVRHLPRHLEIIVAEREAWALIPMQGGFLCVDPEGICLDKLNVFSSDQYCIITMDQIPTNVVLGQIVAVEAIQSVRQVWQALSENSRAAISDYHYVDAKGEVILYTNRGTEIRFGTPERLEDKVGQVDQVIIIEKDYEKKGSETLRYVDLRFKGQPVVKTLE